MTKPAMWALGGLLVAIPLGIALWVLWPEGDLEPGCTLSPHSHWRNGQVKLDACNWRDGGVRHSHYCAYTPDGSFVGCWIEKDGRPWSGTMVQWYPAGEEENPKEAYGQPKLIKHFQEGRPAGVWRAYYPTGTVMSEVEFEDNLQVEIRTYSPGGDLIRRNRMD